MRDILTFYGIVYTGFGIGKQRHGVHFRTAPLMKRPQPSFTGGWFLLCGRKKDDGADAAK